MGVTKIATPISILCLIAFVGNVCGQDVASFKACMGKVSGAVVHSPGDSGYPEVATRGLYPSPAPLQVVEVTTKDQVAATVNCSRNAGYKVCTRSGGHDFIGRSSCLGVLVDTYRLKQVQYDASSQTVTFEPGNTLGEMFYALYTASKGTRMVGIGLCPSVGTGGYLLGGGHNPYSGLNGLTCDSMVSIRMVTADGKVVVASANSNRKLFWASCGGGGGHWGIVIEYTLKTHDASVFNKNVFFRYQWPVSVAGEVIRNWLDYDQDNGMTWFRLEVNKGDKIYGYGVCWDVTTTDECESRFKGLPFFKVAGRQNVILHKGVDLLSFQKFIGALGDWGWKIVDDIPNDEAFMKKNFLESGLGFNRLYISYFLKFPDPSSPSADQLQKVANDCASVGPTVQWLLCQFNPWKANNRRISDNAFAHHDAEAFIELIAGNDSAPNPEYAKAELQRVEGLVSTAFSPWFMGIYNNYPEFGLNEDQYLYLYYGQTVHTLAELKESLDPNDLFVHLQPIPPVSKLECPVQYFTSVESEWIMFDASGESGKISASISGKYERQYSQMVAEFQFQSNECVLDEIRKPEMATVTKEVMDKGGLRAVIYTLKTLDARSFILYVKKASSSPPEVCTPVIISMNGIACSEIKFMATPAPTPSSSPTTGGPSPTTGGPSPTVTTLPTATNSESPTTTGSDSPAPSTSEATPSTTSSTSISASPSPSPSGSESPSSSNTCFPADAMVELEDGSFRRMDQLETGDFVRSTTGFSPVFFFTHRIPPSTGETFEFVRIEAASSSTSAASKMSLELSRSHYLYLHQGQRIQAADIQVGDFIEVFTDGEGFISAQVTHRMEVQKPGLYNPHTLDGDIVVNGVKTSSYTSSVDPTLAHALLSPLRLMFKVLGWNPLDGFLDQTAPSWMLISLRRSQ